MRKCLILGLLFCLALPGPVFTQIELVDAFPHLNLALSFPSEIQNAGDGTDRIFVNQNDGFVYVMQNDTNITEAKIFLDISDRIANPSDGLLATVFHPDYENTGYFYIKYVAVDGDSFCTVVSRFSVSATNPDSAEKNSELEILKIPQSRGIHCGGTMLFGPHDGYLYITLGDGGPHGDPFNHAQNLITLRGSLLRIDVNNPAVNLNYGIPDDNPFVDNPNGYREEIFAYGFRNLWRLSYDLITDRFWAGDVGQGEYEEINIIRKGNNYGWHIMEGLHCFQPDSGCNTTGLELPVWEYPHNGTSASVAGGYVYRGVEIPEISGKYIYADSPTGRIWMLDYDGINPPENELLLDTELYITTFGLDENNELLLCAINDKIYRVKAKPVGIANESYTRMNQIQLSQNYPNPFNAQTRIEYELPEHGNILLELFNVNGEKVKTLFTGAKPAGYHRFEFNAGDLASGIYYYQIKTSGVILAKKMLLIR